MIDLKRTVTLISGALFDRDATWRSYLPEAHDWQKTAVLLTGPLIVASSVCAYLLALVFGNLAMLGMFRPTLFSTLAGMVASAVAIGVVSFIYSALSGTFGGKHDIARSFAAVTLAFVPGYVGQALVWLPWVGGLLAFGLGIYSLVLLWKIIPLYLEVPEEKRAAHYIVSLIATIVAMAIIGSVIGPMLGATRVGASF